jgi:hypothetical protein
MDPADARLQDVFYEEYEPGLSAEQKTEILKAIHPVPSGDESIEFLYLNGDDQRWNWGKSGLTNAAFLHGDARNYFRQFF